ncbi:MAG: hypothetical protein ABF629_02150 [Sporolactobacillus sp.]
MKTIQIIYTSFMSAIFLLVFIAAFPNFGKVSGVLGLITFGIYSIWKDKELIRDILIETILSFIIVLIVIHIWGLPF